MLVRSDQDVIYKILVGSDWDVRNIMLVWSGLNV
jgi:hypothetical protein